jgi:hypothetical protein
MDHVGLRLISWTVMSIIKYILHAGVF